MATPAAILGILIEANTNKAVRAVREVREELEQTAVVAKIASKSIADDIAKVNRMKGTAHLDADVGRKSFEEFDALVKQADKARADAKLTADVDAASFAKARAQAGTLGGREEVKVSADVDRSSFARATAAIEGLGGAGGRTGGIFSQANLSFGQWAVGLGAALPVVIDLTAALGALTASLGAAVAGAGALAIGAGGAATVGIGGIVAIAAPAVSSLKDLMTAQTAADKARVTGAAGAARSQSAAAQQIKSSQEQVATANRAVITSEQQLADAQRSEKIAQDSLTLARKDAVRQLEDMKRASIESGTSEKRARLSLQEAEANLRKMMASGTASRLDIRDAELSIVEARQNLKDVTIQANRSQQDYNKAQKGGVSQMPGVISAQESLHSAVQGVQTAQQGVAQAHRDVAKALENLAFQQKQANTATQAGGTSLAALALAQKKAGPAAVKFADSLKHLGRRWKELTVAGKADFFGLLTDGLKRTEHLLPMFAKSAQESMKAARMGFDQFLKKVTGPEFRDFIHTMTDTFAKSMKPIGDAFGNIGKVLERIAVAVAPDVLRMVKGFDAMTQGWADSTRNAKSLQDTIHGLVNQTNTWWKLIKAAGELIVAVLVPGMGQGKKAVEGITASLKEWTNWVNSHPKEMREFFKQGLETTKQLAQVLLGFLPMLFQISTAMRPIARFFLAVVKGLNSIKVGNVSALTVLLGTLVGAKIISGIAGLVGALGNVKKAWLGIRSAAIAAGIAEAGAGAAGAVGGAAGGAAATAKAAGAGALGAEARATLGGGVLAQEAGATAGGGWLAGFGGALAGAGGLAAIGAVGFFTEGGVLDTIKGKGADAGGSWADGVAGQVKEQLGPKLNAAFRSLDISALGRLTGKLDGLVQNFKDAGVEIPKDLRRLQQATQANVHKVMESLDNWQVEMKGLKFGVFDNLKQIRDRTKTVLTQVTQITGISADKRRDLTVKSYQAEIKAIKHAMDANLISTRKGLAAIRDVQTQILKQYGLSDKEVSPLLAKVKAASGGKFHGGLQRGGLIPGSGDGDKVHVMAEPGEGFINKTAVKKLGGKKAIDRINAALPRFAKGGMAAMVSEANKFESHHFPYSWGGGHGGFGIQPVDCSGAVSDVLHAAGLLKAPMVSGDLAQWGKSGKGALTVYANPEHTFMSLAGKFFGTSGSNPGGGAGWMPDPGASYRAGFASRTMKTTGGVGSAGINLPRFLAGHPVSRSNAAGLNMIADAAEQKMRAAVARMGGGAFGGGQAAVGSYTGSLNKTFPKNSPLTIAFNQAAMLAEKAGLPGVTYAQIAQGESGLRPGAVSNDGGYGLWQMTPRVQSAQTVSAWNKIGSYFNPWRNALMAKYLAGSGTGVSNYFGTGFVTDPNKHYHGSMKMSEGGMVAAPYVGSFDKGGEVAKTGLGMLHKGEHVLNLQRGGHVDRHHGGRAEGTSHMAQLLRLLTRLQRQARRAPHRNHPTFTAHERQRLHHLQNLDHRNPHQRRQMHVLEADKRQAKKWEQEQKDRAAQIAETKELIGELKVLRKEISSHNKLATKVRANERGALNAVLNLTANGIGARYAQQRRNAAPGAASRY